MKEALHFLATLCLMFPYQTGALDLITTSTDILSQDLRGVFSFRHLSCQLEEIQSVIGKMLLGDFKTYISTEINKDVIQAKVSIHIRIS